MVNYFINSQFSYCSLILMFASKGGNIAYGNTQYGVITLLKPPKTSGLYSPFGQNRKVPSSNPTKAQSTQSGLGNQPRYEAPSDIDVDMLKKKFPFWQKCDIGVFTYIWTAQSLT